jgi:hypothetical protein
MSFVPLTTGEIATGEPVTTATATKIKDNFDDHEERLQVAELSSASYPPIIFRVNGYYNVVSSLLKTTNNFDLTILGARILIDIAGTSGITEIDLLRKRGVGAWESIFTTQPTVAFGAGDNSLSTDTILDPTKVDLEVGDILRLDITSAQVGGKGFLVRIDYNRA